MYSAAIRIFALAGGAHSGEMRVIQFFAQAERVCGEAVTVPRVDDVLRPQVWALAGSSLDPTMGGQEATKRAHAPVGVRHGPRKKGVDVFPVARVDEFLESTGPTGRLDVRAYVESR